MEHKPLIERLWGIARTHSFAAFESSLHEASPDGSLKALTGALRHLAGADQHRLAQELLAESLDNHVASPQIFWRLEMLLLLGHPEAAGKQDAEGVPDLATLEKRVRELVQADRLDEALDLVGKAAQASAAPQLYELLGRLHLRRGADRISVPAVEAARPEAAAPDARPPQAAAAPTDAVRSEAKPAIPPKPQAVPPRVETRPPAEQADRTAESAAKAPVAEPPRWVAEELLKARARAQEAMQKRAGIVPAEEKPAITAVAAPAVRPDPAPVEIPAPDEPKEQLFARLREAFARLGKTERKLLAWIMANPNQNAAQIARSTELGNAEVATALKGLTGLWLDPFTFAGYTVRDYVLECMSMGKQAPAGARQSMPAGASRTPSPSPARVVETPRAPMPAARPEAAPAPAKPAGATGSSALADLSGLDRQVLEYIRNHPGCSPNEVMEAMGPDEPASVSLVTLRRDWLDRDAQGRYTIKPAMVERIPSGDRAEVPLRTTGPEVDDDPVDATPERKSRIMESLAASPLAAASPPGKESARLARLPKGQLRILQFLHDNGQARTKDIARTLDQEAARVNSALLGPLADFVSVTHSFWRLNDDIRPALATLEASETAHTAEA
ncbi:MULTISPECIES: hypothetical protein [Azotobacter]|uniref:hypothetical protein n=1 Tax=Azotobacter TaxID=352 RepID=UPI00005276C8|nr:hypothetical protein [Azotobacter vinelandii]WKN19885.1 hypothetical protein AVAEIV_002793 [Azotobacter vinelandii]GLK58281.1 hypothetical protein GCM10017624_04380 [Azotobacter vinelandii]SFY16983.1 hypothetical protein SAMN04244547_04285 [Azotobacter vinelandii]